MYFIREMNFHL